MWFSNNAISLGKKKLSYSKLKLGSKCGFAYKHKHMEYTKPTNEVENYRAIVGNFIHEVTEKTLEYYHECSDELTRQNIIKKVESVFEEVVIDMPLTTKEAEEVLNLQSSTEYMSRRILTYSRDNSCHMYLEKELAFNSEFEPVAYDSKEAFFRGKLDVILVDPKGNVIIIDHKTGYRNTTAYDIQLKTYEVLVAKAFAPWYLSEFGEPVTSIRSGLNFIESESLVWKSRSTMSMFEINTLPWFVKWVSEISDSIIEAKVKRGTHCNQCGFRSLCGSKVGLKKKKKAASMNKSIAL